MIAKKSFLICAAPVVSAVACLALCDDQAPDSRSGIEALVRRSADALDDVFEDSIQPRRVPLRLEARLEAQFEARPDASERPMSPPTPRELLVLVCDPQGLPIPGIELVVERESDGGDWLCAHVCHADQNGEARVAGLRSEATYRVGANFPLAPAPVPASDVVHLSIERPRLALVELRSANGYALSGARRVEIQCDGASARALSAAAGLAQWKVPLTERVEGTLHVTDSLGRRWSERVALVPGEMTVATPDPDCIAIARADLPGTSTSQRVEHARLRWSLSLGDGRPRRGSGWLASNGGFHAVIPRAEACASGGLLVLRWDASTGERELVCGWYADPSLEHIELQPSPLGEITSL